MNKSISQLLIIVFLFLSFYSSIFSQDDIGNIKKLREQDGSREEIQRYFGYEDIFFRFTTLPYDVVQNTNQTGRFVDIGFTLFAILPIIILSLCFNRRIVFYTLLFFFIIYLNSCFLYSYVLTKSGYLPSKELTANNTQEFDLIDRFLSTLYKSSEQMLRSYANILNEKVDDFNYVVYLFLFTLFLIGIQSFRRYSLAGALWIILLTYSFLWLILSGGILWYGFLIIPVGMILLFKGLQTMPNNVFGVKITTVSLLALWIGLSSFSRISYLDYRNDEGEHAGKSILNGNLFPYAMGFFDEKQTLDFTSPKISTALDKINSNDDYIYMIGTSYAFDISNNIERIFQDNLLKNYAWLIELYEEKNIVIDALKASNFRYIIVDLNTPSLDKTPEKSLTQKFKLLMNSLYKNPKVSLIATDRTVEFIDVNGTRQKIANVYGNKIINYGSYAVYEIL